MYVNLGMGTQCRTRDGPDYGTYEKFVGLGCGHAAKPVATHATANAAYDAKHYATAMDEYRAQMRKLYGAPK